MTTFDIGCLKCKTHVGVVQEIEIRPGIFQNVCSQTPMPKKCDLCDEILTRLN
jgi:hypothetical protein